MMDDIGLTAKMGLYINNVQKLVLNDVSISGCEGEPMIFEHIGQITGNQTMTGSTVINSGTEGERT